MEMEQKHPDTSAIIEEPTNFSQTPFLQNVILLPSPVKVTTNLRWGLVLHVAIQKDRSAVVWVITPTRLREEEASTY
jgi:hypothetical protein